MSSGLTRIVTAPSVSIARDEIADISSRRSLFQQVGQSIGEEAADKLVADFGGRRLYIPMTPAAGDVVTGSIGLEAALAMSRVFGGDRLLIPSSNNNRRRRAEILALRRNGTSISRIARELRCTERYVYKVLAAERIVASKMRATRC